MNATAKHDSQSIKQLALNAIDDLKALEVSVLDVSQKASFTDTMIFASGSSNRHVKSIADEVLRQCKQQQIEASAEGLDLGEWVLVDLGDVVLHVMLPQTRAYYDLEKLWSGQPAPTE